MKPSNGHVNGHSKGHFLPETDLTYHAVAAHYGQAGKKSLTLPTSICHGGDSPASLSINPAADGGILGKCFTRNCTYQQICDGLRRDMGLPDFKSVGKGVKTRWRLCGPGAKTFQHVRVDYPAGGKTIWYDPKGAPAKELLYRTGDLAALHAIFCEGEKAADAVETACPSHLVLGTLGENILPSDAVLEWALGSKLETITFWPDNDDGGISHMHQLAKSIERLLPDVKLLWVARQGMRPKWDAADLPLERRLAKIVDADVVEWVEVSAKSAGVARLSPTASPTQNGVVTGVSPVSPVSPAPGIDTLPEIPPGSPFPVDALGKFAAAAEDVHRIVKTPLPICAASVLGSLSVVVQGAHDVELDGRVEPTSLYMLSVAPSGARKTACDNVIFREIRKFDKEQKRAYHEELREYKRVLSARKGAGPPLEPPADPKVIFTDGTGEAIQRDAHKAKYGTRALVTDEGGRLFGGYSLTAERQPAGLSVFSSLWDGGEITIRRMGEGGSYTLYDRRVMLHVQVQGLVVKRFLTDPMVACQGLLGRFLLAQIDKVPAREYQSGNPFETNGMVRLYAVHRLMLRDALLCEDIDQGTVRKTLTLSPEAMRYWAVVHDGFEDLRARTDDDAMASFYGKAPAHVLRIAGVLAVAHSEKDISTDRIRDAARIVQWYAADMERAQDVASVSDADRDLLAFRNWLKRHEGETITVRTIQRTSTRAAKRGGAAKIRGFMSRLMAAGYPLKFTTGGWEVGDMGDLGDKPATTRVSAGDTVGDTVGDTGKKEG